jgi:hypothetical protein
MAIIVNNSGGSGSGSIDGTIFPGVENALAYYPNTSNLVSPTSVVTVFNDESFPSATVTGELRVSKNILLNDYSSFKSTTVNRDEGEGTGITSVASEILEDAGSATSFVLVSGDTFDGKRFFDVVIFSQYISPIVMSSNDISGSPATRTYSLGPANQLYLAVSSGIYGVTSCAFKITAP